MIRNQALVSSSSAMVKNMKDSGAIISQRAMGSCLLRKQEEIARWSMTENGRMA